MIGIITTKRELTARYMSINSSQPFVENQSAEGFLFKVGW